ncbi:MAG: saccharopine dehydrogenase NADP-binding domain-containing protein [Nannocystis sp.]|nr:saccharopine dehydrogenase NADP-binding domain-containing protein [Nannocystis sp.]
MTETTAAERAWDLVVFGATGFVGRLIAEYLARHAPAGLRVALAGRSEEKLRALRAQVEREDFGVIVADVDAPSTLAAMARAAKVVMTTVGPYVRWGEAVVQACVAGGAHYLDLTGEPAYVGRIAQNYHEAARARGVAIVPCCGFDSIPPDLGAYFTVLQLPEGAAVTVTGTMTGRGSPSGGTVASALGVIADAKNRDARQVDAVAGAQRLVRGGRVKVRYDREARLWVAPLPTIDPAIVRRSARLVERYGPDFSYQHQVGFPSLAAMVGAGIGVGAIAALAQLGAGRRWLGRLRPQGEGPSAEVRARSWFRMRFVGVGGGVRVVTEMNGGDPGYDETAKMFSEAALCLALGESRPEGGVLTPVAAVGDALLLRLEAAGLGMRVVERGPA